MGLNSSVSIAWSNSIESLSELVEASCNQSIAFGFGSVGKSLLRFLAVFGCSAPLPVLARLKARSPGATRPTALRGVLGLLGSSKQRQSCSFQFPVVGWALPARPPAGRRPLHDAAVPRRRDLGGPDLGRAVPVPPVGVGARGARRHLRAPPHHRAAHLLVGLVNRPAGGSVHHSQLGTHSQGTHRGPTACRNTHLQGPGALTERRHQHGAHGGLRQWSSWWVEAMELMVG